MILEENEIRISMDGKGQALDNVRTERYFRTIKYDDIYINEYNTPKDLRKSTCRGSIISKSKNERI